MATSIKKMNEAAIERAKLEKLSRQQRRTSEDEAMVASRGYQPLSSSWQNTRLVPADVKTSVPSQLGQDTTAADRLFEPPSTLHDIVGFRLH